LTILALVILSTTLPWAGSASAKPFKHRVTGLFMPERVEDLRELVKSLPDITLVDIDFKTAEATFDYDPEKLVAKGKPDQIKKRLNGILRSASRGTFGIMLTEPPTGKLTLIVIPVAGLDCKACSLAAYEAIYQLDGVERATASFRDGQVTALIDPKKTDRGTLEAALKKKGVTLKAP
jgi:hypothetical protein